MWKTFYLEQNWTVKEVSKFVSDVENKLLLLSQHPEIGRSGGEKHRHIRRISIHKRISLVYRIKNHRKKIELLLFWNTYQNPGKLKFRER